MRNSPINNIRARGDYSSSPYQSNVRNRSPGRDPSNYSPDRIPESPEAEYWRTRAKALQSQLLAVNEELMLQMRKNERINDLEDKIQLLLAQNTHFVDQNENLIKLLQQKNQDIRLLKQKLDHQYTSSNIAEAQKKKVFDHLNIKDQQHQLQIEKLVAQINRLHDQMVDMQNMKQIEISQLKNKYENEAMNQIQTLKRSQYGNNELQELNIRKLKDQIEQKNFQVENLRRQSKLENERLNGQISFLRNEIKKLQNQKQHELNMIKTENENAKNNLIRAHRKNEEQLKNLHQTKLKRLSYELEERKNQVDDLAGRLRKTGKQNENDLNRLTGQKGRMKVELKENDVRNNQRIKELTIFYETQLQQERENHSQSQRNLQEFYTNEINSLKQIIEAKEQEIRRLLEINRQLKENEEKRLNDIISNNNELKRKIQELVLHYEREIELMKIKISQLYEADIEALRSKLQNTNATHNRQTDNLRMLLRDVREELAKEIHLKLELRKEYDNRLNEFKIKYQREHQQLQDLIMLHEKQVESQTSKISMTQIQHTQTLQTKAVDMKKMMAEKRQLETQIVNKNKQIQALNLRIQKMMGFHKRQVSKLEEEIENQKAEHQKWLQHLERQTQTWNQERAELKERIHQTELSLQDAKNKNKSQEEDYLNKLSDKNMKIAALHGQLDETRSKTQQLQSKVQVQVENVEKTYLDTQALMNVEKERWLETSSKQKTLMEQQFAKERSQLHSQIEDLARENDLLKDNYEKGKIREQELKMEISNLLDSVNQRSNLEERVINIGLSNNQFKNVAEIFKKTITL